MYQFTDDEIETVKEIICEHGSDCPSTDWEKVQELKYRLGLEKRPTPEELAEIERRRKEFAESATGKIFAELMAQTNENIAAQLLEQEKQNIFFAGEQWDKENFKIGSTLRIKLPIDYNVKGKEQWLTMMAKKISRVARKIYHSVQS